MRRWVALAVCGLVLLPSQPVQAWGSLKTGGHWPMKFNTHGCLDRMAYAYLQQDPAFPNAAFPSLESIQSNEGIDASVSGPGPDSEGSSRYSQHYYNPRNQEGSAPAAVAENFLAMAYKRSGAEREKAAAWGAHFLADTSVPYHINGEWASDVRAAVKPGATSLILDAKVTGDRSLLGRSSSVTSPINNIHGDDFKIEADRFLAAAKGQAHLDWFDPWYWNGSTDYKSHLSSSHLMTEGLSAPECPGNPVSEYSILWPGNPVTQFGDPTAELNRVTSTFVRAMAKNTQDNAPTTMRSLGVGEAWAAESIATLWRASFSAMRTDASVSYDPTTLSDPKQSPIAVVKGQFANLTAETARSVQMRVRVISGACRLMTADTREVQTLGDATTGSRNFGLWKVQVPRPGQCRVTVEAIGRYYRTPDLQLAWRNFYLTAPELQTPKPSGCACKPGDMMCQTLCRHDPGSP